MKSSSTPYTLKFRYSCQDESLDSYLTELRRMQTSVVNFCVNRMSDAGAKIPEKELRSMVSTQMDNIKGQKSVSYLIQCGVRESIEEYESFALRKKKWEKSLPKKLQKLNKKLERKKITKSTYDKEVKRRSKPYKFIRGGRENFEKRLNGEITHEDFKRNRLLPYYSIGEAPQRGNRLFTLYDDFTVLFKPDASHRFILDLSVFKSRIDTFIKLVELQNSKSIAITYKLDSEYIYITFEQRKELFPKISNMAVTNARQNR